MGIDIRLFGMAEESSAPLERLKAVALFISEDSRVRLAGAIAASPEDEDTVPSINVPLFPCCDPLVIMAGEEGIAVEVRTSHAGPGYHEHVCELLDRLGKEFGLTWEVPRNEEGEIEDDDSGDETGFFWDRDRGKLETAMLRWLRATCQSILDTVSLAAADDINAEDSTVSVCMPMDTAFLAPGLVHTPLGPREKAWVQAVASGKNDGRDFFAWWERGTTPRVKLLRALTILWSDLRWRPAQSELEDMLHHEVHALLEEAYREEPSLPFPCREWQELLSFGSVSDISQTLRLEIEHNAAKEAKANARPLIGYRRGQVRRMLSGFSFVLPGSFGEEIEDDQTWLAFDTGRTIRMSNFTVEGTDGGPPPTANEVAKGGPDFEGEADAVPHLVSETISRRGAIRQVTEDDTSYTSLNGLVAGKGCVALVQITFDDPQDQSWAIELWKSITPPGVDGADAEGR